MHDFSLNFWFFYRDYFLHFILSRGLSVRVSIWMPRISQWGKGIFCHPLFYNWQGARLKGGFSSESAICFSNLKKNIPNRYPELEIWISCLLLWAGISNFKFRIVIWSNLFWRFEQPISLSEKKPFLVICQIVQFGV